MLAYVIIFATTQLKFEMEIQWCNENQIIKQIFNIACFAILMLIEDMNSYDVYIPVTGTCMLQRWTLLFYVLAYMVSKIEL